VKETKLEGKALADKYLACTSFINTAKWDDLASKCLATTYKGHTADGDDTSGPSAVVDYFKAQAAAFPDMKLQPQLVAVNGRNILAVALLTGTHTGTMKSAHGELPATNKKIGQLMFHRVTLDEENRVSEEWAYFDPATMMGQLGLLPPSAPKLRPTLEAGWQGAPIVVVATDDAKEKANLDVAQKSAAAYQAKKWADYTALYTDEAVEADQATGIDNKGKKQLQSGGELLTKAFPDLKLETVASFAAGDFVFVQGTLTGTNDGPLGTLTPTKKQLQAQYAEVYKLADGKIAELWRFRNGKAMAAQLGLIPTSPAAGSAAAPTGTNAPGSAAAPKAEAPPAAGSANP